ncbi:hypothetical protein BT63DRAFT_454073 [Microthyrium microscopicum]|uniref:F-box domain-containing protein n=1 Tax=Microthyrium microscopicum TaxID=703497 RepID=A0A6A6UEA6_9PEZI|nr:hypothetical protein BT63DRAFT_454073 [Microthyrium microscopicum]
MVPVQHLPNLDSLISTTPRSEPMLSQTDISDATINTNCVSTIRASAKMAPAMTLSSENEEHDSDLPKDDNKDRNDSEQKQKPFPFMKLPAEIRNMIYRYLFTTSKICYLNSSGFCTFGGINFLQTSKTIHQEATYVLYSQNRFTFSEPCITLKRYGDLLSDVQWSDIVPFSAEMWQSIRQLVLYASMRRLKVFTTWATSMTLAQEQLLLAWNEVISTRAESPTLYQALPQDFTKALASGAICTVAHFTFTTGQNGQAQLHLEHDGETLTDVLSVQLKE